MDLVSGDRLWIKECPILHKYPYLSENIECDVAIIGAGVIGAICAYYLTEAGINTVIVDKNIIGYGSTSASTSILEYEVDYDLIELKSKIGFDYGIRIFKLCEQSVYDIEEIINALDDKCGFSLRPCFYYSEKKSDVDQLKKEYELRKEQGFDVEYIDRSRGRELFSFPLEGGIYSHRGAGELDPYRFAHALLKYSTTKGLKVYENTGVTGIEHNNGYASIETDKNRFIKAKKIIDATGYEGRNNVPEKTVNLNRSYTIVTKPIEDFKGWHERCLIRDFENPYTYLRTTSDNRIIIGGEDTKIGGRKSKMADLRQVDGAVNEKYALLEKRLHRMFPNINNKEIEYQFNGIFGETGDGLPYIGEHPDVSNTYFSLCYGSNGILYGIIAAKLLRDLYLGRSSEDLHMFRFGR